MKPPSREKNGSASPSDRARVARKLRLRARIREENGASARHNTGKMRGLRRSLGDERRNFARHRKPVADRAQIARAAALQLQPRQRPAHVRRGLRRIARTRSRKAQSSISAATASSRRLISSTSAEGETSRLISSRAPAAVTVRSMAENTVGAPSFSGPHQLQARARGRVDGEKRRRRLAFRRRKRGPLAHLGQVHIMKKRADRGEVAVREIAQPVERRNLERLLQRALALRLA